MRPHLSSFLFQSKAWIPKILWIVIVTASLVGLSCAIYRLGHLFAAHPANTHIGLRASVYLAILVTTIKCKRPVTNHILE